MSTSTSTSTSTTKTSSNTQPTSVPTNPTTGLPVAPPATEPQLQSPDTFPTTNPSAKPPSPATGIFAFFIITLIFTIIKYSIPDTMLTLINIIYIGTLLAVQITINSSLAKTICNNPQARSTGVVATIFPMLFIFGLLQLLLTIFPGWLEPFSNTFGYAIAKIGGAESVVQNVLKPQAKGEIANAISNIYNDPSIFLNQFNYDNKVDFDLKWEKSNELFNANAREKYTEFRNMVKLKDLVSQFVWYMLAGILVTSRSYNYIINQPCTLSPDIAEKIASDYAKNNKDNSDKNTTPAGFVYDASN
jgi:hypothetical protein